METKDVVFKALQNSAGPMKAAEIAELTGIDKKDISKAIKILVKEEKAFSPKYCYYSVKQD